MSFVFGEVEDPERRVFAIIHPGSVMITWINYWAEDSKSKIPSRTDYITTLLTDEEDKGITWDLSCPPQGSYDFNQAREAIENAINNGVLVDGSEMEVTDGSL